MVLPEQLSLRELDVAQANEQYGDCCVCQRPFGEPPGATNINTTAIAETFTVEDCTLAGDQGSIDAEIAAQSIMMRWATDVATGSWRDDGDMGEHYRMPATFLALFQFNNPRRFISSMARSLGEQAVLSLINGPPRDANSDQSSNQWIVWNAPDADSNLEPAHPYFLEWNTTTRKFGGHAAIDWDAFNAWIDTSLIDRAIEELADDLLKQPSGPSFYFPTSDDSPASSPSFFSSSPVSEYESTVRENTWNKNSRWYAYAARVEIFEALVRAAMLKAQDGDEEGNTPPSSWKDCTYMLRHFTYLQSGTYTATEILATIRSE